MAYRRLCTSSTKLMIRTSDVIKKELKYTCHSYHPLPVAINKGKGTIYK